jgi:hypothetical protein
MTRVQIPAYTDRWMMGDQYGELIKVVISKKVRDRWGDAVGIAHVKLDISGKTVRVLLDDCTEVG